MVSNSLRLCVPLDGAPLSMACATVLSHTARGVCNRWATDSPAGSMVAVLNIYGAEYRLRHLVRARMAGLDWPVVLLTAASIESLWRKYRILRFDGVHITSGWPLQLSTLVYRMRNLSPMEPEALCIIHGELSASRAEVVGPVKALLTPDCRNAKLAVTGIAQHYKRMWPHTSSAWHEYVDASGLGKGQAQHLFRETLKRLETAASEREYREAADSMISLFEWCATCCMEMGIMVRSDNEM